MYTYAYLHTHLSLSLAKHICIYIYIYIYTQDDMAAIALLEQAITALSSFAKKNKLSLAQKESSNIIGYDRC